MSCLTAGPSLLLVGGLCALGCNDSKPSAAAKVGDSDPSFKIAGVYPDQFDCASVTTPEALGSVLGAPTKQITGAATTDMPRGLPKPCTYEVATATPEQWTYDIDCRDNYKKTADLLFQQYREWNNARIEGYRALVDAGVKQTLPDGGAIEYRAPGNASDVTVGAKGLDHNDQGLIFIDDDAPCYVRVSGPDATRRLEMAKLIAKNLTFKNAPMTPRSIK